MGPDLQWIKRAQACGMSDEDIQAYLDAWQRPVPSLRPDEEALEKKRAADRERMRKKRSESRDSRATSSDSRATKERSPTPPKENNPSPSSLRSEGDPPLIEIFPTRADLDWAVDEWNELAADCGLPKAIRLTEQRRRSLIMRLRELGSREAWTEALMQVARSPFCKGDNNRGWRANLDFVLQPSSLTKLIEGFYDGQIRK